MASFTDQMGNTVVINGTPKRIISLVPSQTELLFDLGSDEEVIGITKYCVHPKGLLEKIKTSSMPVFPYASIPSVVGGTKKLNIEKIKELKPDLIIGNKEENEKSQIVELMKYYPVWMSDIKTLEDALSMIDSIGKITGKENKALTIQNDIREQFSHFKLQKLSVSSQRSSVLYLIWKKPYICAGENTFIDHILRICGLENVLTSPFHPSPFGEGLGVRYPEITAEQIQKTNPSLIFLSSEPYPFRQKHILEFQNICPKAKVVLVDGEMFSWYGSRLLYAPSYFEHLLKNL